MDAETVRPQQFGLRPAWSWRKKFCESESRSLMKPLTFSHNPVWHHSNFARAQRGRFRPRGNKCRYRILPFPSQLPQVPELALACLDQSGPCKVKCFTSAQDRQPRILTVGGLDRSEIDWLLVERNDSMPKASAKSVEPWPSEKYPLHTKKNFHQDAVLLPCLHNRMWSPV